MSDKKLTVLQIATDYPDGSNQITTQAVKNLLDASSNEITNITVSIRRVNKLMFASVKKENLYIVTIPKIRGGFLCTTFLFFAAINFYFKYKEELENIDVVHSHKLTIDGVFAYFISKFINSKLVVSIRGTSDEKFYKWKFQTRLLYNKILKDCEHIFFVSMWSLPFFKRHSKKNIDINTYSPLPNICEYSFLKNGQENNGKFLFVGSLDNAVNKGLFKVIDCIAKGKKYSLDIYGSGNVTATQNLQKYINEKNVETLCILKGKQDKTNIYSEPYLALILPSYPETFGMVFVEALMSGIPIVGSNRAGLSGYLPEVPYAIFIDDRNVDEIYAAMSTISTNNSEIKQVQINDIQLNKLSIFDKKNIVTRYVEQLKAIL